MTTPFKTPDDMPADFRFWATPDLGGCSMVTRAACMRMLLRLAKEFILPSSLDRVRAIVVAIQALPDGWKQGCIPNEIIKDSNVQEALLALENDPRWREDVAGCIRDGRFRQAMGSGQFLDVVPILLPKSETPARRSERMQRVLDAFRQLVPGAQEAVVADLLGQAKTALLAKSKALARVAPGGPEWVFEVWDHIHEDTERFNNEVLRLPYPQDDFPGSLPAEERPLFLHAIQGRIAEMMLRADMPQMQGITLELWRKSVQGDALCRDLLVAMGPLLPLPDLSWDLGRFGTKEERMERFIAFYRAIQGFRGDPPEDDDALAHHLLDRVSLNGFFGSTWGEMEDKANSPKNLAEIAKRLGIR